MDAVAERESADEDALHLDPVMAAVERFETTIIQHDALSEAVDAVKRLQGRHRPKGKRRLKARALIVAGESGSGKTTLLEAYDEAHPVDRRGAYGDVRRVVFVEMPKRPTQRQFVASIMTALGYRVLADWNASAIIDRIATLCDALEVEALLIDEAHQVVENANPEHEQDIAEFLKSLLNRLRVQIVLAGLPSLRRLEQYSQLRRRLQPPVILQPYDWTTVEGRGRFLVLLEFFEAQLNLPEASGLQAHDVAKRLYCATGGHVGLVSKYLSDGLERALRHGRRRIDIALLGEVHDGFNPVAAPAFGLDPDAKPVRAAKRGRSVERNPFLASDAQFKVLWARMAKARDRMSAAATARRPRQAALEHLLYDYEERFAA